MPLAILLRIHALTPLSSLLADLDARCTEIEKRLVTAVKDAAAVRRLLEAYIPHISRAIFDDLSRRNGGLGGRILSPRGLHVHVRRGARGHASDLARGLATGESASRPLRRRHTTGASFRRNCSPHAPT